MSNRIGAWSELIAPKCEMVAFGKANRHDMLAIPLSILLLIEAFRPFTSNPRVFVPWVSKINRIKLKHQFFKVVCGWGSTYATTKLFLFINDVVEIPNTCPRPLVGLKKCKQILPGLFLLLEIGWTIKPNHQLICALVSDFDRNNIFIKFNHIHREAILPHNT